MSDDETKFKARPSVVSYPRFRISVEQGPDREKEAFVVSRTLRVGRDRGNDFVLTDPFVSNHHCALEPTPDGVRIRDEGSRNEILMFGARVRDITVNESVRLQLGDTVLLVEPQEDREAREQATSNRFGDLLGQSACMRELFADLARIAKSDAALLIEGETGTGKELVAESVHAASQRTDGPFVIFDCGAVAPTLVESDLFGQERGAFTDAVQKTGVFEQADGGTLFLDELGELPKELQPKLLRVLQSGTVRRLGSQKTITVDVRVVAATNRNLEAECQSGGFRPDLFFRFAARVRVPPLRDRMEDLPLLAEHFLSRENPPRKLRDIPKEVWAMFQAHQWPGNVRELGNALNRIRIQPSYVLPSAPGAAENPPSRPQQDSSPDIVPLRIARREAGDAFEREYLKNLLEKCKGNVHRAAGLAEVSRQLIQRLLRRHGMG